MSMQDIYPEIILVTDPFDDESVEYFSTWCGTTKLSFIGVEQQHKYQPSKQKTRRRLLWVLKKGYPELTTKKTLDVDRERKARIEDLKKDEYQVIDYVRKSPGKENASTRLRLLDSMVDRLIKDSSVDMLFASYSSIS